MTKVQRNSQGKIYVVNNKALIASSGGGSTGKYALLDRVKDDSNNEIGTVCGFFTDANDTQYAVVCLDAQYRLASAKWTSNSSAVTNLPEYQMACAAIDLTSNKYTDTATSNCDKILAWCSANGYTSAAVSHCRSQSFVIDGVSYYGQLPNLCELYNMAVNRVQINNNDTSVASYPSLDITNWIDAHSSSQVNQWNVWYISAYNGSIITGTKATERAIFPVLEIPNN